MGCNVIFKPRGLAISSSILIEQVATIVDKYPHLTVQKFNDANPGMEIEDISEITQDIKDVVIEDMLSHFRSEHFLRNFGEWETANANINSEYLNVNGEPLLFKDVNNGKYFYKNKFDEKIFFPLEQNGLNSIPGFSNERINKAVKVLGKKFFMSNFNLDYSDLSFIAADSFDSEIEKLIKEKIKEELEIDSESVTAYDLEQSLTYINEWSELVKTYFKSIGFKVEDSIIENDDEVGNSEELIKQASYTQDSKDKISSNVKVLLSVIEDTDNDNIDYIFEEAPFVDFNDIYNTILSETSGTTVIEEAAGDIKDAYNVIISKIKELAIRKPYLNSIISILEDPNYPESKKTEFFQAFYLTKNNFFVSEISVGGAGLTHVVKDVSDSSKKFNTIKDTWFENFKEVAGLGTKEVNYDFLNTSINTLNGALKTFNKNRKDGVATITNSEALINSMLDALNNVGINIDGKVLEGEYNKALATDTPGVIITDINRIKQVFENVANGTLSIKDNIFNTQSIFSRLAQQKAFFEPDSSDNSINSAGKSYWGYSYPSHIQNEVNKWKAPNGRYELDKVSKTILGNESSVLLNYLTGSDKNTENTKTLVSKKRLKTFKVGIFNVLQDKKTERKKSDPKDNTSLSKNDAVSNALNQALRIKKEGETTSLFYTPTPADKATAYMMQHDFFLDSNLTFADGKYNFSDKVLNTYFNYFKSEYKRMIQAHKELGDDSVQKIVHYHTMKGETYVDGKLVGNAFKSQLFPSLSPENINKGSFLYDATGAPAVTLDILESKKADIKTHINNVLNTKLKETKDNLVKTGVFAESLNAENKTILTNKGIDYLIFANYVEASRNDTNNYTVQLNNLIADYFVNTSINLIEYSKMFSGDPAYYKNMVDYSKRIPATYTDGLGLRITSKEDQFFNASVIAGVEVPSPYLKELRETVGDTIAAMYESNNTTDAQAWITPKRWRFLLEKTGLWTTIHDSAYNKVMGINKEPFTEKEKKAVAQPLKGVYFSRDTSNLANAGRPTYLKYSQAVLLPDLIKGSPLERIYDKMVALGIDETITIDGVKAGAITPEIVHTEDGQLADEFELNSYKLDNRGWKLQQNLPTKTTKDTNVGSQIQKNALMGVANYLKEIPGEGTFNFNGETITGREVYDGLNEVIGELSNKGVEEIKDELGINEDFKIENIDGLYNMLLKDAKSKGIESQNLIRAIEKNISIYGIPGSKEKLFNMFFSIVKDRAVKIKTNGGSMIQTSNFGIDRIDPNVKTGIKWLINPEKGLKPPLLVDGKVQPGQILLPGSVISKYIPNWNEIPADELKEMIDPEILNSLIGYRIPNQGLSSNDALEIVGFLPEGMGDAVVAFSEIPTKTGSDFDIDKMFMMIPSFYPKYKGKAIKILKESGLTDKVALSILSSLGVKYVNKDRAASTLYDIYLNSPNDIPDGIKGALDAVNKLSMQVERLVYVKPRLDENGEELPNSEQSKDALKNKLIQYYKSIFTHPEVIKDVMMPIDFDFIKDHITSMFPEEEGSDLDNFDIMKQIDTKYLFISGKAGVGLTANALVDYVRGLFYDSKINTFNVDGKLSQNGETSFDTEYSQELTNAEAKEYLSILEAADKEGYSIESIKKLKISHSISAFLNAYVDIAKDPYVTRGNWTTQTSNVGFLLLRAGVHPFKVNSFMAQPIIKQYVEYVTNTEAKIGDNVSNAKLEFIRKFLEDQAREKKVEITQRNGNKISITQLDLFNALKSAKKDITKEDVLTKRGVAADDIPKIILEYTYFNKTINIIKDSKALASMLKNRAKSFNNVSGLNAYNLDPTNYSNNEFQLSVIQDFYDLLDKSKKMGNLAKSAKPDVSGSGKNLTTLLITENLTNQLLTAADQDFEFANISDRYKMDGKSTILGHYYDNSIKFPKKVIEANPNLFFTGSEKVATLFNEVSTLIYGDTLVNPALGDILNSEFYTFMMSGFEHLKDDSFYDKTKGELIDTIENYKQLVEAGEIQESNFLLDNLAVKSEVVETVVDNKKVNKVEKYLVLNRSLKGDDVDNKLYSAWKDLLNATGEEAAVFNYIAENLVKYSYYQSGFNMNRTQFFTAIPHEFFVQNNFNDYMRDIASKGTNFSGFIDQFFKHNWKNDVIVPQYSFENPKLFKFPKGFKGGVLIENTSVKNKLKPYIKVGPMSLLAKLKGIDEGGNGIYLYTNKLGNSNEFGNFTEYNFDGIEKNTIFAENNPVQSLIKGGEAFLKEFPPVKTEIEYYTEEETTDYSKPALNDSTITDGFDLEVDAGDSVNKYSYYEKGGKYYAVFPIGTHPEALIGSHVKEIHGEEYLEAKDKFEFYQEQAQIMFGPPDMPQIPANPEDDCN